MNSADPQVVDGAKDSAQQVARSSARPRLDLRWEWTCAVASLIIIVLAFSFDLNPDAHVESGGLALPSVCWFRNMTGMNCPGCGLTRGFVAIAEGNLKAAWDFNPASWLWFGVIAAQIPWRGYRLTRHYLSKSNRRSGEQPEQDQGENTGRPSREHRSNRLTTAALILMGLSLIVQWIVRLSWRL